MSPSFTLNGAPHKCTCHLCYGGQPANMMHAQLWLSGLSQDTWALPVGGTPLLQALLLYCVRQVVAIALSTVTAGRL